MTTETSIRSQLRCIIRDNASNPELGRKRAIAYLTKGAEAPVYAKTEPFRSRQEAEREAYRVVLAEFTAEPKPAEETEKQAPVSVDEQYSELRQSGMSVSEAVSALRKNGFSLNEAADASWRGESGKPAPNMKRNARAASSWYRGRERSESGHY
jgi:hypothetical protein